MTGTFILLATLLVFSVVVRLGLVLWRGPQINSSFEGQSVNMAVLRDQILELDHDRASGTLSARDYDEARQDVQRRVLEEANLDRTVVRSRHGSKYAAVTLAVVLPLASAIGYLALGNPAAITPTPMQNASNMTQADMQTMVDSLAARLALSPDDPDGWLMLARSYRYLGRLEEAAKAFAQARAAIEMDPQALSEYAETLARSSKEGFTGMPTELLGRALSLDPKEPFALTLAGAAAFERGDHKAAIQYWQQLLEQLPPNSDAARVVSSSMERAREEQAKATSLNN